MANDHEQTIDLDAFVREAGDAIIAADSDGLKLSIAFTVALLRSPTNEIEAIVAIVRDETKRWAEEGELRSRLSELESRTDSGCNSEA